MEFTSGNIYIRAPIDGSMKAGETVVGHAHNFDHTTYVKAGALEICLLEPTELNANGLPIKAEVVFTKIVSAKDEQNWLLILRGKYHSLRALEDGTVYHCIYSHRLPQAITLESPGEQPMETLTKTDENGVVWYRPDPRIVQDTCNWLEAYR